ncbi:MAG TPA: hypothetical protein VGF98_09380 [Candidatus Tumulicola sp.]|jgi:hypothetical protein
MKIIVVLLCAIFATATLARADEQPTNTGPLSPSEQSFVDTVRIDLLHRFPRVTDAEKAGYVRYTGIDDTGAVSYADRRWNSDPTHPSQLWYDVSGNLLGADFSVPRPHQEARPVLWGIDAGRWYEFNGHVHYTIVDPSQKKTIYDQWVWNDDFTAAGGSLSDPSAETLVKLGRVPSATDVGTIFEFPTIWDLVVWVRPHSAGLLHW